MQTAGSFDHVYSWAEPKVIGVAENDASVEIGRLEFFKADALHRSRSPDGHEHRRLNLAAPRCNHTRACLAVLSFDLEAQCLSIVLCSLCNLWFTFAFACVSQ